MSTPAHFALFATAVGECAVAWSASGLTGIWLPEARAGELRRKLAARLPPSTEAPPSPEVATAIAAIGRLLDGEAVDLRAVPLDLGGIANFARRVYAATREIAPGRVVTYGTLAARMGADSDARAVGQALGANPFPIVVPCHRVVAADGGLGGFSAPGGTTLKRHLLAIENARLEGPAGLFD